MKDIVLLSGSNSRNSGGLFNSVKSLAFSLMRKSDLNIYLVSYNDDFSDEDRHTYDGLNLISYNLIGPTKLGYSNNLDKILEKLSPDIIHQQGIWMFYSRNATKYRNKNKDSKLIITPRGMLDPWILKNGKWKKGIVKFLYQNSNLKKADCLHALCESEYLSMRKYGLKKPVAIIPNGVNLPSHVIKQSKKSEKKILLFISRIHPKKGLDFLIEVLNIIKIKNSDILKDWKIRIAGWSQIGHQEYLIDKCKKYKLTNLISFIGPVYNEQKEKELSNADAFILPSYSEGLPMSILEAWSYKLPVIMTKECNLPDGFTTNSAIFIDHDKKQCSNTLINFFQKSKQELLYIGNNGYNLVNEKYTWDKVAEQTVQLYNWIENPNKEIPNFIRVK